MLLLCVPEVLVAGNLICSGEHLLVCIIVKVYNIIGPVDIGSLFTMPASVLVDYSLLNVVYTSYALHLYVL